MATILHPHYQKHHRRRLGGLIFSFLLLAVLAGGWLFRQDISDWWRLREYQAPPAVVALADETTMTDKGRRIYYTTHPQITDREQFNSSCRQGTAAEYSIILGCYINSGGLYGSMYLYNVNDQRLDGVMQVTAAHEMLHAAYDRLSDKERQRVDQLLRQAYERLPADSPIRQAIAQYEASDPAAVPSELHSILGTELRDLPAELEDYYRRYFSDRQVVVGFAEAYGNEFLRRENQVARYDEQLANIRATIDANQIEIEAQLGLLQAQQAELESLEASGNFEAYNSMVPIYNQAVNSYNALVTRTRDLIDQYNQIVAERNSLAVEVQSLQQSIDSRPQTL